MSLRKSLHTFCAPIKDSESWYIINPLSGQADLIGPEIAGDFLDDKLQDPQPFIEKGYYMEEDKEKALFNSSYLDFIDQQDDAEVQIFYVPDYFCNFKCTYCYQEEYGVSTAVKDQTEIIDAFFKYLDKNFAGRSYYLTLFGGEPLLTSESHKKNIFHFLDRADERGLSLAIVTNGYSLESYLPRLKQSKIREIQITLDGPAAIHDVRRPLKGGVGTFQKVSDAVNMTLQAGIRVNLRAVIDKHNIDSLPALAQYAIDQGWTESDLFVTQLGRNYELHSCQKDHAYLYTRIGMYEKIYELINDHPEILEFHKPAFSLSRFLSEEGELPQPLFDSCPGAKTEWAFDYTGNIYSCTATVGKKGEELGQFFPEIIMNEETIEEWQERDVCSIEKCRSCAVQLACGGGCAAVAKNRTGSIMNADCRPIKELMTLGLSAYLEE
ncbi:MULTISPECIES: radical SAM/SPASM domain-containing protein [unclassified Oceanispirochaeta]|uniref:radical SAM/SPASM domain-containing protein n=1 Tax=unclassified Oceanispirochaeta TaxID=2635722 RepID=UPI000E0910BF|nr:radical SAM protein [Oceanispirochaeta sp. M1]MBF9015588.1 radical SAM protein [Oceanispirochaeta sp. M2]NPD73923.1 radical SAM protein [Oceanispirochaeta sp. M1]RDG30235.1 radical SAM protein [Oceanispirochaeta sp. M1]